MSNDTSGVPPGWPPGLPPPDSIGRGPIGVPGGTDRSYSVDIIVCAVITGFIGSVFVALRFYTRGIMLKVLSWEDWLILVAQVSQVGDYVGSQLD